MNHKQNRMPRRWVALATAASLLAVCILLLAGQVFASDQGPAQGVSPLERMGMAPLDVTGPCGPSSVEAEGDWDGCQLRWPSVISDTGTYRMWYGAQASVNPGYGWLIGMAESEDGMTWDKAAGNPVLELGDKGEWDDTFRGLMAVLKDGGTYKMWYTGGGSGSPYWQIGYATSTDGSDWDVYASNPVLQAGGTGSWDEGEVADPTVIKDGGTYKMWYVGWNADYSATSIGYATSTDGVVWTKHAGNPVLTGTVGQWDEGFVSSPMVIKNGSTYEMWYNAGDEELGRATSPDGMAWTKDTGNPVLEEGWDGGGAGQPAVLLEDGAYSMWLVSSEGESHGIGLAESADGVGWDLYDNNPVLEPGDPSLMIFVNPDHDGVEGQTCRSAEVTVTVGNDEGAKATATGLSEWGYFGTWDWDWDPEQPDIAPGDAVTATWDMLETTVNPVGEVEGTVDYDDDTASGTIHAPWFSPQTLQVRCGVHTEGAPEIEVEGIAADGGAFTCDFGDEGWDLEPGPDVWAAYVEPDGDGVMGILYSLVPYMTVDYDDDFVQGEYEAGHTVWITITESDETTVKAVAEVTSYVHDEWGGWTGFETHEDVVWTPERPDIEPGDWAFAMVDNGYDNEVRVGTIDGEANREADIVSGTISAPWLSPNLVAVSCEIHENDGRGIWIEEVDPKGGAFFCDFSGEYDIQFDTNVAVNYNEPDSDRVQTHFREPVPDMRVEKWPEGSDQVAAGGPVVFGLRYRNDGEGDAETIVLTDTLPADTAYDSDTSGVTPTIDGDQVIWELGPLPSHQESQFFLVLTNDADPGDTLTNQAEIYTLYDSDDWNNYAEAEVQVVDEDPDLYVYKNRGGSEPTPGQTFLYEIDYGNDGPVPSGEVQLTDTLPEGTTVVSWSSRDGHDLLWTEESSGDQLVLSAPAIPGNWGDTLLLRLLLDAGVETGTQFTNTVEIETAGDTNPDNNYDERQDWVGDPNWNAGVDKQYGWGSLAPGREVGYNLHVRNHGSMAAGIRLTDTLPVEASFVEASRWTGSTDVPFPPDDVDGEVVVWDLGTMEPGEWYDLNIRLKIKPGTTPGTVMRNCATVAIDGQDTWPLDDTACTEDRVNAPGPNLRVRKEYQWEWEGQLKYDVLVENIGTTRLEDVWITDTYPESTTFEDDWWVGHGPWVTMTHDAGAGEIIFWAEEFDPGNSARINFKVNLDDDITGEQGLAFTNTVEAPLSGDVYPADNEAEVTAYTGPDMYARKRVIKGKLEAGERITFLMEYGNRSFWPWEMSDETEILLSDTLPTGMTYVAAFWPDGNPNDPESGGAGSSEIVWRDGRLGGEDTRWFTMVVDLAEGLDPGQELINTVAIAQDPEVDIDPVPGNNHFSYKVVLEGSKIYLPLVVRAY